MKITLQSASENASIYPLPLRAQKALLLFRAGSCIHRGEINNALFYSLLLFLHNVENGVITWETLLENETSVQSSALLHRA